jgi:hypothetical protein
MLRDAMLLWLVSAGSSENDTSSNTSNTEFLWAFMT